MSRRHNTDIAPNVLKLARFGWKSQHKRLLCFVLRPVAACFTVEPNPGVPSSELMNLIESTPKPKGCAIEWGLVQLQEKENEGRLKWLVIAAFVFAYLFLAAKNAILMVEFLKQEREGGATIQDCASAILSRARGSHAHQAPL